MTDRSLLIDTNIWHFGYIAPTKEKWNAIHQIASSFLSDVITDSSVIIFVTTFQVAEIMEVLRKHAFPVKQREEVYKGFKTEKFRVIDVKSTDVDVCFKKSLASGIHIYDYLVAIPLKGIINEIFSADDHFQHEDFQEIAKVNNPLSPWIIREGRIPRDT